MKLLLVFASLFILQTVYCEDDLQVARTICDNVIGPFTCAKLEELANKLHIKFTKVTDKLRELVAKGVTSATELFKTVTTHLWKLFWGNTNKRSLDITSITNLVMQMVEKVVAIGNDVRIQLQEEIRRAIQQGRLTIFRIADFVKEMIAKYGPMGDEVDQEDTFGDIITQLRDLLKKAHGTAKAVLEKLLVKAKGDLQKLKDLLKSVLGSSDDVSDDAVEITYEIFADAARKELDDELNKAEDELKKLL